MWLGFILVFSLIEIIAGHGRLMEPPARNSMWRFGYGTPINYSDNEVFCGGVGSKYFKITKDSHAKNYHFSVQFKKNDGKCGVCGDDWSLERPRENENGGHFGTGTIARTYVQGQVIEVEVELTTNHWGWFEMKLCPVNDKLGLEDDKCMDKHPLYLANEDSTKFFIPQDSKKKDTFKYKIKLPNNVVCSQCVLQWTYRTGLNFSRQKYNFFQFVSRIFSPKIVKIAILPIFGAKIQMRLFFRKYLGYLCQWYRNDGLR